ncbi:MAG: peptide chain release factor N(5)-glutamine methyltransferase [Oceanibaculum nanhaiense]|uniref:peptide chain release factor N(5)-glutamine methyltransferase n=1 Tax=Oceanibaculum nanhaiense TaxID=1909734 RepID=UPI0025A490C5|nr:peptide chain release factor N(5)-glutamine methyltransferase [Oceanibaculum nanhaiense]MDM7945550.1 peptide chain release factor N(5)-glutamine methyltransferase [Oceanibaculum nanhaiense]
MTQAAALLRDAAVQLEAAGVEEARRDARLLLAEALGVEAHRLILEPQTNVPPAAADRFAGFVAARAARVPVSRILGRREFWGLTFRLSPATLDPRPDSETLVEAVLKAFPDRMAPLRVLDFGTGTGCLLLAVLSEYPNATGLGIDKAEDAVATASTNADDLGLAARVEFRTGDWGQGLGGQGLGGQGLGGQGVGEPFDIILSNPPYIEAAVVPALAPEVARHDPLLALAGGADGLDAYRRLLPDVARLLAPQGHAFLELGQGQAADVAALAQQCGLMQRALHADLAGIARCLELVPGSG